MCRRALPLVVAALVATAAVHAASASGAVIFFHDVTETQNPVDPFTLTVEVGESIAWWNRGFTQRTVRPRGHGPFTVDPRDATPEVRYSRPGRYPFAIDGIGRGTIIVRRPFEVAEGRARGSTWKVIVHGTAETLTTTHPAPNSLDPYGTLRRHVVWRSTYPRVRVAVRRLRRRFLGLDGLGAGSAVTTFSYNDERQRLGPDSGSPCSYGIVTGELQARVSVSGQRGQIAFQAQGMQPDLLARQVAEAADEQCGESRPGASTAINDVVTGAFTPPSKLLWDANPSTQFVRFQRRWAGGLRAPLSKLVRGRSFTARAATSRRTVDGHEGRECEPDESCVVVESKENYKVSFRR